MKKRLIKVLAVFVITLSVVVTIYHREAYRLYKVVTLFYPQNIVENFQNMTAFFPYRDVENGPKNITFEQTPTKIIDSFEYKGDIINIDQLLENTNTTGFIVIKDRQILAEKYYHGFAPNKRHISWSLNKSFISALVGIALEEGLIKSIDDPITEYVPELNQSGYARIPIKHILQMSSGVAFDENYADFYSDINRMGRVIALGSSINEFAMSLQSEKPSGTHLHYVSMDTQVLGILLQRVTGQSPSYYLQEKIWSKLGMMKSAHWLVDDQGMELVFGTLNATLRDYARFGMLFRDNGQWNGQQIVPEHWVTESTTAQSDKMKASSANDPDYRFGYGYQWWLPPGQKGDFLARGIYGQYIYVDPKTQLVIARTAATPNWKVSDKENMMLVKMFQAISERLSSQ